MAYIIIVTCALLSPGSLSSSSSKTSQTDLMYPVSTAWRDTSNKKIYTAGCGGRSIYSEGAMNSIVDAYLNVEQQLKFFKFQT